VCHQRTVFVRFPCDTSPLGGTLLPNACSSRTLPLLGRPVQLPPIPPLAARTDRDPSLFMNRVQSATFSGLALLNCPWLNVKQKLLLHPDWLYWVRRPPKNQKVPHYLCLLYDFDFTGLISHIISFKILQSIWVAGSSSPELFP